MKEKVLFKEITGKTIEGFASSLSNHKLFISFTDATFVVIGFVKGFHREEDEITDVELDTFDFYSDDLVSNIFDSTKELTDVIEGTKNRAAALAEIVERKTYERLKTKYDIV